MLMPTMFLTILGVTIYTFPVLFNSYDLLNIESLLAFLLIISIFIPVYEYRVIKNKRGADLYYSLPLNRKHLNLQIFLKGLIEIITSTVLVMILTTLIYLTKEYNINYLYLILFYLTAILSLISLYSFNVFIFKEANNIIDGIIFIGIYLLICMQFVYSLDILFSFNTKLNFIQFSPLNLLFGNRSYFISKITKEEPALLIGFMDLFMYLFWTLLSIGLGVVSIVYTKNNKPELVLEKSSSYLGYITLIPVIIFSLSVIVVGLSGRDSFIAVMIIGFLGYVLNVIYERSFKVNWINMVIILGVLIAATILSYSINYIYR